MEQAERPDGAAKRNLSRLARSEARKIAEAPERAEQAARARVVSIQRMTDIARIRRRRRPVGNVAYGDGARPDGVRRVATVAAAPPIRMTKVMPPDAMPTDANWSGKLLVLRKYGDSTDTATEMTIASPIIRNSNDAERRLNRRRGRGAASEVGLGAKAHMIVWRSGLPARTPNPLWASIKTAADTSPR